MNAASAELARLIQTALAPAFLLAGLATLVSTLTARLGRVSDRVDLLAAASEPEAEAEALRRHRLSRLAMRSQLLDMATTLASAAGIGIACAVAALFMASMSGRIGVSWSAWLFLAALALTVASLSLFIGEVLMAGHDLRAAAGRGQARGHPRAWARTRVRRPAPQHAHPDDG